MKEKKPEPSKREEWIAGVLLFLALLAWAWGR